VAERHGTDARRTVESRPPSRPEIARPATLDSPTAAIRAGCALGEG
jgi:hypothetical protein